jgi:hypothetical protein
MWRQMTVPAGLALAGAVIVLLWDSTAGQAVAFALFGVGAVLAVSLVFLAVGRAEDEERAAAAKPPEPPEPPEPPPPPYHERPAVSRRRPRPPRRPS